MASEKKAPNASLLRKHASRIAAAHALYARNFAEEKTPETIAAWADSVLEMAKYDTKSDEEERRFDAQPERALLITLLESAVDHESAIAEQIEQAMGEKWQTERTGPLLYAILHTAVAELLARPDKNSTIIISEYVDITDRYFDEGEVGFVNGILSTISGALKRA